MIARWSSSRKARDGGLPGEPQPTRGRIAAHLSSPLFRNAYLLILSSGLMSALGFPFWAIAARQYTTETVGLSAAVVSTLMLVSGVAQLGLTSILVRYIPGSGPRAYRLVLWSYGVSACGAVVLGALAAATSSIWSPPLAFLGDSPTWFAWFVLGVAAWTLFALQDSVLTGLRRTEWVTVENAVYAIAKLVLVAVFASSFPDTGILLAWIVPAVVLLLPVNIAVFVRFLPHARQDGESGRWGRGDVRRLAVGNYVGTVLLLFGTFALPIIVANHAGAEDAAYFFIPWTVIMGLSMVAASVSTSMVVEVAFAEVKQRQYVRIAVRATMRIVIPAALIIGIFGPSVLTLFGREYAEQGGLLLRLLAIGAIPNALVSVGLSVARIRHDGRHVAVVQGVMAVTTIGLSVLLLPWMGIEGVGVAWVVSQVIALLLTAPTLRRA